MVTGKPSFAARGGSAPLSTSTPKSGSAPSGAAQSSGKSAHARSSDKVEGYKSLPTVHTGGGQTFDSKLATAKSIKI